MPLQSYIGILSGTSMDAIDAVLVDFTTKTPASVKLIETYSNPIPLPLKKTLLTLCRQEKNSIHEMGEVDIQLGRLFGNACIQLLNKTKRSPTTVQAIGSHGQTIWHAPNQQYPFTLQIGDPNTIVAMTGITTIADFRRRDMALGGQGAPLAPTFHNFLFRTETENRWIVNIGGIANLTYLPANKNNPVLGFDTGPGNTLLDAWCHQQRGKPYDHLGQWATQGHVNAELLSLFLSDPYFQCFPPKSTGPEYFNLAWLQKRLSILSSYPKPEDIQATLLELTAKSICDAISFIDNTPSSIWICGGGVYNKQLMQRLQHLCQPHRMASTETLGVHPKWLEAICFAWLAQQTLNGLPGNLPSVTGAKSPAILGAIYRA